MKIRHQRADVTGGIRTLGGRVFLVDVVNIALDFRVPVLVVPLVYTIRIATFRHANMLVRQEKFSHAGIEGIAVYAAPCRVDEHRTGAISDIASGNLVFPRLQEVFQGAIGARAPLAVNRENRADGDAGFDIGGTIQG